MADEGGCIGVEERDIRTACWAMSRRRLSKQRSVPVFGPRLNRRLEFRCDAGIQHGLRLHLRNAVFERGDERRARIRSWNEDQARLGAELT